MLLLQSAKITSPNHKVLGCGLRVLVLVDVMLCVSTWGHKARCAEEIAMVEKLQIICFIRDRRCSGAEQYLSISFKS